MSAKYHAFGLHAVSALLKSQPERVIRLYVLKDRRDKKIEEILNQARDIGIAIEVKTRQELDQLTQGENHQGVVAFANRPRQYAESDLPALLESIDKPFVLVLDGVQDPHNLGACFRSADAAGVNLIIAPKDNAVGITPVVSKVACGAVEHVPFVAVTNLARSLDVLKKAGLWLYGADADGETSLFAADLNGPVAIVMGAEGTGMRRLTREHCDVLLNIPMQGSVSSLNVSVATGIFLYEVVRQRLRQ